MALELGKLRLVFEKSLDLDGPISLRREYIVQDSVQPAVKALKHNTEVGFNALSSFDDIWAENVLAVETIEGVASGDDDHADTSGDATALSDGVLVEGHIDDLDSDWFSFTALSVNTYTIEKSTPSGGQALVTTINLYGPDTAAPVDLLQTFNSSYSFSPLADGTYFLQVKGPGDENGDYGITVTQD